MKSSSISFTEPYFGLATSSSSSTSTLRKESYERAAFSALRASASSRSAFFCQIEWLMSKHVLIPWRREVYLGGGCGTLNDILAFDPFNPFCFMIDDALNLRLVETIYDGVFALRNMDYTAIDDMSSSFFPMLRRGAHCVSPKMCRAQLDELFGTNRAAYSLVVMKRHLSYSHISRFLHATHARQSHI
jgi:hypothetical protein